MKLSPQQEKEPMVRSLTAWICLLFLCLAFSPSIGVAECLSREQGDTILEELRQIRTILDRLPRRPGPMQVPAPQVPVPQEPATQKKLILTPGGDYSLGRADAQVTIVEYTDYECQFCGRFWTSTFPEIKKNFIDTGKVRFVKRDLPLEAHPNAFRGAQASRCAGDQGKYWEMHGLLSANSSTLGPDAYIRFARDLSLDAHAFKACIEGDRHLADIRASSLGAAAAGITMTPVFVIGTAKGDTLDGIEIKGAKPYAVFEQVITDFLRGRAK